MFYDRLRSIGLQPEWNAVGAAQTICMWVWNGVSPDYTASQFMDENPTVSLGQAQAFVALAILVYCPPPASTGRKMHT